MEGRLYKTLKLDNQLELNIYDKSTKIAADGWFVKLAAIINIEIRDSLFNEISKLPADIGEMKNKLGNTIDFKIEMERNFIHASEKETVYNQLVNSFLNTNLKYISKPIFPGRYIIKKFLEKK